MQFSEHEYELARKANTIRELESRVEDMQAENARLRQVLQEIIDNCGCCEDVGPCANCERAEDAIAQRERDRTEPGDER